MSAEEKEEVGLTKALVRLSFGLENTEDIKNDLIQAFEALEK